MPFIYIMKNKTIQTVLISFIIVFTHLVKICSTSTKNDSDLSAFDFHNTTLLKYCMHWNITFIIASDSNKKQISVNFNIFKKYEKCFSLFKAYLYQLWSGYFEDCDTNKGIIIYGHVLKFQNQIGPILFKDLKPRNYCVLIEPCYNNTNCFGDWSIHSTVVSIDAIKTSVKHQDPIVTSKMSTSEIISIIVVLVFTIGVAICVCWKKYFKWQIRNSNDIVMTSKKHEETSAIFCQDIDIYIFYPDITNIRNKVMVLKDFLTNVAFFHVVLLEDVLEEIMINPVVWLNQTLKYKCSQIEGNCDSNKRFIIVETHGLSRYINYKPEMVESTSKYNSANDNSSDVSLQTTWFHYTLESICIDWVKGLRDYCHLFVVCFEDSICYEEEQIPLVHNVRYTIPDHLIKLCIDLNSKLENSCFRDTLSKKLMNHPISFL